MVKLLPNGTGPISSMARAIVASEIACLDLDFGNMAPEYSTDNLKDSGAY